MSIEAEFHKRIKFLSKRHQGKVMGAFREVIAARQPVGHELRTDLVPGVVRCAKCAFQLHRRTLYLQSGTVGSGGSKTEPCPNGCGPLWPVTWETWAREGWAEAERLHLENAALSAHPSPATCKEGLQVQLSPAGQGDALAMVRSNLRSIADLASKAGRDPVAIANINCEVTHALQLLDLAARQPVGEPVAYLDLGEGGYMDVGTDLSDEELAALPKGRHMLGIIGTYGVDGYKPAQAVDLGRFRPAVMTSLGLSSPHSIERETLRELLALIDSKAGAKP